MDTLAKVLVGLAALWLLFGGRGLLDKHQRAKPKDQPTATFPERKAPAVTEKSAPPGQPSAPGATTSASLITSLDFLKKKSAASFTMDQVRVSYYVLARSARCAVDSLTPCLQERIRQAGIDAKEFQYTYFLDQVLVEGSGILEWQGREFAVSYDKLRALGWTPERNGAKNIYTCSNFKYLGKQALDFVNANLSNRDVFTPIEEARSPQGLTASGQPAVDWCTVSVNPGDFPMSVPDAKRRDVLAERYTARGQKKPAPRSFIVLEFPTGEKFLTEASDTGSGVQPNVIDWRIGNTAAEIAYKDRLGSVAKATCYTFDDPTIGFEMVLEQGRGLQQEEY